jgi:hypothetical protein
MVNPTQGRLFNLYFLKHGNKIAQRSFIHIQDIFFFFNLVMPKPQFGHFSHRRFIAGKRYNKTNNKIRKYKLRDSPNLRGKQLRETISRKTRT